MTALLYFSNIAKITYMSEIYLLLQTFLYVVYLLLIYYYPTTLLYIESNLIAALRFLYL